MGAYVVTKPTAEPVGLVEAKAHLRINSAEHDAALSRYLIAARIYAENYTRRVFITQTWQSTLDYCWPECIVFPVQPVASVTSVTYVDESGATQTLATSQYQLVNAANREDAYIVPAYDVTWPSVRYQPAAITVRFVAGYGANASYVPEPIRQAILLHAELMFDRDPMSRATLEAARDGLLDPYRVVRL